MKWLFGGVVMVNRRRRMGNGCGFELR